MEAPRCRVCGVREWNHTCGGVRASEVERRALRAEEVAVLERALRRTATKPVEGDATKPPATKPPATKPVEGEVSLRGGVGGRPRKGERVLSGTERSRLWREARRLAKKVVGDRE